MGDAAVQLADLDERGTSGTTGRGRLADDLLEGAQAAADFIGKPVRSVYHMVREKQIPHFHIGAKLHFRKSELLAWFSSHQAS